MSENIIFRGAHIRYADLRHDEAGTLSRVHITTEFTQPVMDAMGWEDPGESCTEAKLDGALNALTLILTPGDKQLKQFELQLDIKSVEDFKLVAITKDESTRRELRFKVRTVQPGATALIENYLAKIGDHQAALKISYAKQDELALTENAGDKPKPAGKAKSGCKHCDAGIPTMDNDNGTHVNGQACAIWSDGSTGAAIPLAAPTAAERKKARQAEEAKKKALREESGVAVQ